MSLTVRSPLTRGDADLAAVGSVLADRARARILLALGDGRSLPASVLAAEAGVAPSTASSHLGRLVDAGLVEVAARGRFRYYRLAGPAVGELIEAVARLAPAAPVRSLREGTRAHAVRRARSCYDHLAGRLGVALTDALVETGCLGGHDATVEPERMTGHRPAGGLLDPVGYVLTAQGRDVLAGIGIRLPPSEVVRCCLDWSEQRHHVAGALGRNILTRLVELEWLRGAPSGRALLLTERGEHGLGGLGVRLP